MSERRRVLVVDDEVPALDELAYLLREEPAVGEVVTAADATEALRILRDAEVDVVFLDVHMPGLDGLELARVLARFARPPAVVFVTAFEAHAVEAFELRAADYLLKPVGGERLREALARIAPTTAVADDASAEPAPIHQVDDLATIPVERGGRTVFVARDDVRFVEANGDYARLHTAGDAHLVRVPLATLEERWGPAGFLRIHRGYLVAVRHVRELRSTGGGMCVVVDDRELPVSRRHAADLKDRLVRARTGHR